MYATRNAKLTAYLKETAHCTADHRILWASEHNQPIVEDNLSVAFADQAQEIKSCFGIAVPRLSSPPDVAVNLSARPKCARPPRASKSKLNQQRGANSRARKDRTSTPGATEIMRLNRASPCATPPGPCSRGRGRSLRHPELPATSGHTRRTRPPRRLRRSSSRAGPAARTTGTKTPTTTHPTSPMSLHQARQPNEGDRRNCMAHPLAQGASIPSRSIGRIGRLAPRSRTCSRMVRADRTGRP